MPGCGRLGLDPRMGPVDDAPDSSDINQVVWEVLQTAGGLPLGDWFEFTIGSPMMDITAAPYRGARYPVEIRMDGRIFTSAFGKLVWPTSGRVFCKIR